MGKLWRVIILVGLLWGAGSPALRADADPASTDELVAALNRARAADGLEPLEVRGDLAGVAAVHAVRMADQGRIFHNANLADAVEEWDELGENVGVGPSVEALHDALMGSPGHRRNILSNRFNHIGIAVERRGDRIYAVQVFRRLVTAAAPATAAQASVVAPAVTRKAAAEKQPAAAPKVAAHANAAAPSSDQTPVTVPAPQAPVLVAMSDASADQDHAVPVRPEPSVVALPDPLTVERRTPVPLLALSVALLAVVAAWCARFVLANCAPAAGGARRFATLTAAA